MSIILSFERLRVLKISDHSLKKLSISIDKLKHLRYLDLSEYKNLSCLRKSIGNLVKLQTLKLKNCHELEFSIIVVTKLMNLRHLDNDGCRAFVI